MKQNKRRSDIPEYWIWVAMRSHCNNKNCPVYKHYGGRGITVCEKWNDFEKFYNDMGKRPNDKMSIDRIDNNKGYSPDNYLGTFKTKDEAIKARLKAEEEYARA